uniref:anion permease n=1 Tax=Escherichia coli TaxID=562 RepID=UPI00201DF2A2
PNVLGIEFVGKIAGVHISWMQWFLAFLPVGLLLLIIAPLISYYLYKPGVTHSSEVAAWANTALGEMGKLTRKEYTLIGLVLLSLCLWVFGGKVLDATAVCLLAVSLMLALHVVSWKDITKYSSAWNTLVNLATLVVMANGLTRSGFIDWFAQTMSTHLDGFSPNMTVVALVLVFNGLILWTLVTVSIEWARNGSPTLSGFAKTARSVLTNPLIVGILSGTLFSLTGLPLPTFVDRPV